MEIFTSKTHFDFLGKRFIWMAVSMMLIAMSIYLWVSKGDLKYGIDFRGGTELIISFKEDKGADALRQAFNGGGFTEVVVQSFESRKEVSSYSVRIGHDLTAAEADAKVSQILQTLGGGHEIEKNDAVGPVIGAQVRRDANYALVFSLVAILIYVAIRFEWRFGVGAILALFHDVIITAGFCLLTERQISAGIFAALLTITGYSINDTIIIFDRIRENLSKAGRSMPRNKQALADLMNVSVNETLSRTILTSLTAFFVVTTLFLFGGGAVKDISFALMVGIVVGTYSTVFVACPIVLALQKRRE